MNAGAVYRHLLFSVLNRQAGVRFWNKSPFAIDERLFPCYNDWQLPEKEAFRMAEQTRKQNMSAGLLAHVNAGRGAPCETV